MSGMTTDRIFLCGTRNSQNYNYCNTTIRNSHDYGNICMTETSNMSRKQQRIHSDQLRKETEEMVKQHQKYREEQEKLTSNTNRRSEAK